MRFTNIALVVSAVLVCVLSLTSVALELVTSAGKPTSLPVASAGLFLGPGLLMVLLSQRLIDPERRKAGRVTAMIFVLLGLTISIARFWPK